MDGNRNPHRLRVIYLTANDSAAENANGLVATSANGSWQREGTQDHAAEGGGVAHFYEIAWFVNLDGTAALNPTASLRWLGCNFDFRPA